MRERRPAAGATARSTWRRPTSTCWSTRTDPADAAPQGAPHPAGRSIRCSARRRSPTGRDVIGVGPDRAARRRDGRAAGGQGPRRDRRGPGPGRCRAPEHAGERAASRSTSTTACRSAGTGGDAGRLAPTAAADVARAPGATPGARAWRSVAREGDPMETPQRDRQAVDLRLPRLRRRALGNRRRPAAALSLPHRPCLLDAQPRGDPGRGDRGGDLGRDPGAGASAKELLRKLAEHGRSIGEDEGRPSPGRSRPTRRRSTRGACRIWSKSAESGAGRGAPGRPLGPRTLSRPIRRGVATPDSAQTAGQSSADAHQRRACWQGANRIRRRFHRAGGSELEPSLRHLRPQLAELVGKRPLGSRKQNRFFVGNVVDHVTHQFHQRAVVARRLPAPCRAAWQSAAACRRALERSCPSRRRRCQPADRGVEDFFFQLGMDLQRQADGVDERLLGRGEVSASYWWKVANTWEWSMRIMLVAVGDSFFSSGFMVWLLEDGEEGSAIGIPANAGCSAAWF